MSPPRRWYGNWDDAERKAVRAVDAFPIGQSLGYVIGTNAFLLQLRAMRGSLAGTRDRLTALAAIGASDAVEEQAVLMTANAFVAFAAGENEAALEFAANATELIHKGFGMLSENFRQSWPVALEAATALGLPDRAARLLMLVSADPTDTVPPYLRLQRLHFQAMLNASTNAENSDIEADLQTAITGFGDLGYPYWQARAQLDLASWLTSIDRVSEAVAVLGEALATGQRLGAQPLVDEVNRLIVAASDSTA